MPTSVLSPDLVRAVSGSGHANVERADDVFHGHRRQSCTAVSSRSNILTDDWTWYLATRFNASSQATRRTPCTRSVVEIVAGIVVLIAPRFGGLLVAGWLAGIIVNLLLVGGYGDIALRDFGLLVAAISLSRLASAYQSLRDDPRGA